MNKKYTKMVAVLWMLTAILWSLPVSAQADIEVRYEPESQISPDELTQMLAPIALYPDVLLSQILIAAAYPFEVVEAERWVSRNPQLSGEALNLALEDKNWDVSVLALCHYPKVLTMMADNLSWTARLGDAFVNQEQDLMVAVQELRTRAKEAGHLTTTSEQAVIVEQRMIRIEPVSYDFIYVPAYDPHFIYGPWWIPAFPPFFFVYPGLVVTGPRIIFSPGIYVRYGYVGWSRFDWRDRRTVIVHVDRHRRHPGPIVVNKYAPRVKWAPDRDRRYVRERRAPEIERYRPPSGEQKKFQDPVRTRGGEGMTPSRPAPAPLQPRITDRKSSPEKPLIAEPERTPLVSDPDKPGPPSRPVIERDSRSEQVKPPTSRQSPMRDQPAVNQSRDIRSVPREDRSNPQRKSDYDRMSDERPNRSGHDPSGRK